MLVELIPLRRVQQLFAVKVGQSFSRRVHAVQNRPWLQRRVDAAVKRFGLPAITLSDGYLPPQFCPIHSPCSIPMPDISIEVWDATGNKKQVVQLPANAAVNRVVAVLVQKMNLPQHSPDGQLMSYKFQHRPTGRQLLDTETLASAGVRDGDIVRLQPEITAGRKKGTGPICRNGPQGASHKLDLSPFFCDSSGK